MSQNDFNLANQGFPSMRSDMNSAFQALATNSSGATAPSTTYAYQWWYDETNDILKIRNADNDAWIDFATFDQVNDTWSLTIDGTALTASADELNTLDGFTGTTDNLNATQFLTGRNAIINGNFDHWQRGTSFSAQQYGADRWVNAPSGSSMTQSRQSFTLGQTDVPNEPKYFCRNTVTSSAGAANFAILNTKIEDVRTFAGQTCTFSFWAKADASKNIAVEFLQFFGTGGSPSSAVTALGVTTCSLTTSWQKFTVTVSLPSISGKTIGTDDNSYLSPHFWFDAGSDYNARTNSLGQQSGTFDIAQVQLEAGSVATPFERRPVGTELALCQRYYETGRYRFGSAAVDALGTVATRVYYCMSKRSGAATVVRTDTTLTNATASTVSNGGAGGFDISAPGAASPGRMEVIGTWTADAEL